MIKDKGSNFYFVKKEHLSFKTIQHGIIYGAFITIKLYYNKYIIL